MGRGQIRSAESLIMLTTRQKKLIRETYVYIARREYSTGEMFYQRLFEIAPELRPLFPGEMKEMRLRFIQTIGSVVAGLETRQDVTSNVEQLGKRHVGYGVRQEHYRIFGEAFIWAIEHALGDRFTPEVKEAWQALYDALAGIITRSAYH